MIISTEEAAVILGVSRVRVLQLIYDKRLKAKKRKGITGWLIDEKDVHLVEIKKRGRPKKNRSLRYGI